VQGWNQIQQVVDDVGRKCHGTAFVSNSFWPSAVAGMAHERLAEYGPTKLRAPPYGSYHMEEWKQSESAPPTPCVLCPVPAPLHP
jgi:hypothetical protein